jgi:hypothetical protein
MIKHENQLHFILIVYEYLMLFKFVYLDLQSSMQVIFWDCIGFKRRSQSA